MNFVRVFLCEESGVNLQRINVVSTIAKCSRCVGENAKHLIETRGLKNSPHLILHTNQVKLAPIRSNFPEPIKQGS